MVAIQLSAVPALVCCSISFLLLLLVSASPWDGVAFLQVDTFSFGVFGYTGSKFQCGYDFPFLGQSFVKPESFHRLTYMLLLYPFSALLSGLAVVSGLWNVRGNGASHIMAIGGLATVPAVIACIISVCLFNDVSDRLTSSGIYSTWGLGTWIALGALFPLSLNVVIGALRERPPASSTKIAPGPWIVEG